MNAGKGFGRFRDVASRREYVSFPDWLADQVCRRDEIGHMARLTVSAGVIDRSDTDLVNSAIVEWAQR